MSNNKQKLELTWIGKNNPEYDIANIEPRILEENPELSNCKNDPNTENMIIHGDNLLALKALLPEYEGKVKCIYIDPPYNTGNAFEHYDDSVEHSTWLSLMKPRLELLRILLRDDGVIFVQIDDNEQAYLKILMDEIFGRTNFINTIAIKVSPPNGVKIAHANKKILKEKEYVHVYSKDKNYFTTKPQYFLVNKWDTHYSLFVKNKSEPMSKWVVSSLTEELKQIKLKINFKDEKFNKWLNENNDKIFRLIDLKKIKGVEKYITESFQEIEGLTGYLSYKGQQVQFLSQNFRKTIDGYGWSQLLCDLWSDIKFNNLHNEGGVEFKNSKKPEKLVSRCIEMSTEEGDVVLDSFLGSGTTAATAHKMGRKYIGIEMGDHSYTRCKIRLDTVVDGSDQGGISKSFGWKGGGAYKFYELAPSFIVKDEFGNPIIDSFYNDSKLIKAMCKLMNFTYKPSQTEYWKHGIGQGKNYLFVTTQLLTSGMVQQIASHLQEGETLIVCPKKFEPGADKVDDRITIKKIPQSVLKACHFGKKEYLLPIKENAMEEIEIDEELEDNE